MITSVDHRLPSTLSPRRVATRWDSTVEGDRAAASTRRLAVNMPHRRKEEARPADWQGAADG